jgi:Fe-S cluster assembly protein SufD
MHFQDITHDTRQKITIDQPGRQVLFFANRSGKIDLEIAVEGAEVYLIGLYIGRGEEQYQLETIQHHVAPRSTSDLFIKAVLDDSSKFIYDGLIRIEKSGQQSHAYQKNQNLILSEKAFVASEPNLEILANDVFCTHGSTTGRLNTEQLQYAQMRGLNRAQAKQLLVEGFVHDVRLRLDELGVGEKVEFPLLPKK